MSSINRVQIERQTNYEMNAKLDQTESDREGDTEREGDKPAKIVVARRRTRWMDSVERATAARQLAKELEIGHKLSGVQADGQTDSRKSYEDIRNRRCYCRGILVEQWHRVKGVQKSKFIFLVCK